MDLFTTKFHDDGRITRPFFYNFSQFFNMLTSKMVAVRLSALKHNHMSLEDYIKNQEDNAKKKSTEAQNKMEEVEDTYEERGDE